MQPWLPIGYGAPQCPPPASPSLAGAATSVVMANAARSSGHSCASLRPASPTRSQTPQLCAPDPSPPARPPSRAERSPQPLLPQAARPSPPSPHAHQACAPLAKPTRGPRPLHKATPAPQRGSSRGGRRQGREAGKGGASPSFSERAQSWSQKSRRRDIQTEPRCVWQEERERERGSGRRGREREEREGGGGKQGGGLSFQIRALRASEGQRAAQGYGTVGVPRKLGRGGGGGSGLRPTETAGHPSWPGQDGHRQKPRSMCAGQTEGGLWAAQTHTRTSPHNRLLSMPGQGHGWGPQQGHHGRLTSWEASEKPDCSQPLGWPPQ